MTSYYVVLSYNGGRVLSRNPSLRLASRQEALEVAEEMARLDSTITGFSLYEFAGPATTTVAQELRRLRGQ